MANQEKTIICRCEDVTLAEIDKAFERGFTTFEDLKRILRVGMGPCQGNTCGHLIQMYLAQKFHCSIEQVKTHKPRPMLLGVRIQDIVDGVEK